MDNYQQNQNMNSTQYFGAANREFRASSKSSNTGLIVTISVLSSIIFILIVFIFLYLSGILNFNSLKQTSPTTTTINGTTNLTSNTNGSDVSGSIPVNQNMYIKCSVSVPLLEEASFSSLETRQLLNGSTVYVIEYTDSTFAKVNHNGQEGFVESIYLSEIKTTIPVEKTMYVTAVDGLNLRSGPSTSYAKILSIPIGDPIYVIEYSNDDFAKAIYNGTTGYVGRKYLSSIQPTVWHYNSADVESFVTNSLYAFVDGVTRGDSSYVYNYYSGSIVKEEINSCNSIASRVMSEEILQVNCHSTTRISPMQVTVIRDSVIRVIYNDGTVKDVSEKYKYTVDYSKGRMYIVKLKRM